MKLNKDKLQKAFLVGLLSVGGLYYYFEEMVGPLAKREEKSLKEIGDLDAKIKDAKSKITRRNSIESGDTDAAAAQQIYKVMQAKIPKGQHVAWFPTRVSEYFMKQGISKPSFRLRPDAAEMSFRNYRTYSWLVDRPGVGVSTLGVALAGFENQEGLVEVSAIQIDSAPKDPVNHNVQLTLSTLAKSEK